jgi:hypothetical protein
MIKQQLAREEFVKTALQLGARPGTIRQWFCRGIPFKWQVHLTEYFGRPVEITDWAPNAVANLINPSIAKTWLEKHRGSS